MAAAVVIVYSQAMAIMLHKAIIARELPTDWQREVQFLDDVPSIVPHRCKEDRS